MTTFRAARDGFGELAMVRLPGPHGAVQQLGEPEAGQHVLVQHGVVAVVQHGAVPQQMGWACGWPAPPAVGGQQMM
jgi:hypothetical protein